MGSSINQETVNEKSMDIPEIEFNFKLDPESDLIVFKSKPKFEILLVTFNLASESATTKVRHSKYIYAIKKAKILIKYLKWLKNSNLSISGMAYRSSRFIKF